MRKILILVLNNFELLEICVQFIDMIDITAEKRSRIVSLAEHTKCTQRNTASSVGVNWHLRSLSNKQKRALLLLNLKEDVEKT